MFIQSFIWTWRCRDLQERPGRQKIKLKNALVFLCFIHIIQNISHYEEEGSETAPFL